MRSAPSQTYQVLCPHWFGQQPLAICFIELGKRLGSLSPSPLAAHLCVRWERQPPGQGSQGEGALLLSEGAPGSPLRAPELDAFWWSHSCDPCLPCKSHLFQVRGQCPSGKPSEHGRMHLDPTRAFPHLCTPKHTRGHSPRQLSTCIHRSLCISRCTHTHH